MLLGRKFGEIGRKAGFEALQLPFGQLPAAAVTTVCPEKQAAAPVPLSCTDTSLSVSLAPFSRKPITVLACESAGALIV